ncbi:STAS domain-containing protein [Candidatus Peregrinibacteria bacterium]|nr:STAS domain-containing protein [Candidatus Peregrinibacteria bacterium]
MSDKFSIAIKAIDNVPNATLISLGGDFDNGAQNDLKEAEKQMEESSDGHRFIFDLIKLRFLNSYAIGQFVGWHNILNKKNGKILIVGASKNVTEIFTILGITNLFELYPDLTSALEAAKR